MSSPQPETEFEDRIPETAIEPPRRQRRWLWLLLVLLALAGGGFAVWRWLSGEQNQAPDANAQLQAIPVKMAPVQAGIIEDSQEYNATLESRRSVTLQPRIQGQVAQIFVRPGDTVKQGDPVIQVDAREQQAAVSGLNAAAAAAKSQLESARATLRSLEAERESYLADVKLNQQEFDRYSNLADQGAVSRQTSDQYANRLATARAALNANESKIQAQQATVAEAEKSLQQAQANTKQQKVQLQYYRVGAPFGGTVGDIPVKVGDFVNTSTQLVTITQNQPLEVNVSVPIERGDQLRKGMPVEILDGQGRSLGVSRIFFISPRVVNNTQSILIKSLFDNSKGLLRADGIARARVIFSQRPGVLIPVTAVSPVAGQNFVYVAQEQKTPDGKTQMVARQKRVKLGNITGNNYQVQEGLEPGDRIIVSGLLNLKDGAPIAPES